MPPARTAASTRYGFASPPATRFSIRADFGERDSTRTAADLSSSPHDATVGAAAKPTTRRNELTLGQKIDIAAGIVAMRPPIQWRGSSDRPLTPGGQEAGVAAPPRQQGTRPTSPNSRTAPGPA